MSNIKVSTNLFLEKVELKRIIDFLGKDGFRKQFVNTFSAGLIKKQDDLLFNNGRVSQDLDANNEIQLKVNPIVGIDNEGKVFSSDSITKISIPNINTWYWVKVSHVYSDVEKGVVSIDTSGNISGVNTEFLSVLRQLPNFPSKVRFKNSKFNTQEYQILEVTDNNNAKLSGVSFIEEEGLQMSIVGTFTPGVIIPEVDKYPFQFDSAKIELVLEQSSNEKPPHEEGKEFYVARIRILDKQLVIQDKRDTYVEPLFLKKFSGAETENPLIGIESVKYSQKYTTNTHNVVDLAWCMRATNWSIDSSNNIVTIHGSSLGGRYKSVLDFTDGDFNGWRVYTKNGKYCRVYSSVKAGNAINLLVDHLDVDNYSDNGGISFISQEVLVTPNADFIEIEFIDSIYNNNYVSRMLPINTPILSQELLVSEYPITKYNIKYRYISDGDFGEYLEFPDDDVYGYYDESSFDENGNLKTVGRVRKKYSFGEEGTLLELTVNQDNFYYLRERLDVNIEEVQNLTFQSSLNYLNLIPRVNYKYQIIDSDTFRNSPSSNIYFVNLSTSEDQIKSGSKFVLLINKDVLLKNLQINVVTDFNSNTGEGNILKSITNRDSQVANINQQFISLEFIYSGTSWVSIQNYAVSPINSLMLFSGIKSDFFDNSGLGLYGGWKGYALCNGENNSPNLLSQFVINEANGDHYLLAYAIKVN